jgi:protein-L-isoaspartate(D-aspartate) O-methyltransferase
VAAAAGGAIPPALADQLTTGGRLVAPVGTGDQHLVVARRTPEGVSLTELERVRFVPLVSSRG